MVKETINTGKVRNLRELTGNGQQEILRGSLGQRCEEEKGETGMQLLASRNGGETSPSGRGRKRGPTKGRKLKGSITSNCWNGEHSKCYSLQCECKCHRCVRTGNNGKKFS
jgi:hypothetical protein